MGIASSGNISIKTAAGSGRSIDSEMSATSSGSLVTLSSNSIEYTGGTAPPGGSADTNSAPYGMREFYGYTHDNSIWTVGSGGTQTNYGRVAGSGNVAHASDHWAGVSEQGPSNAIFTLRAEIVNSGNNQSDFNLYVHNTWAETGAGVNYYWTAAGTQTSFTNYTSFKVYRARWTGSGYSNLCPDSFKIDWSSSVVESEVEGDTAWIVTNDGTGFSDNTYLSYPQTAGTHTFGKQFKAWAETSGDAEYDGGDARTIATVTFTPSFRKSGFTDTASSYTHKFYLKANVVTYGEGGGN